jgi:hypothetical protein
MFYIKQYFLNTKPRTVLIVALKVPKSLRDLKLISLQAAVTSSNITYYDLLRLEQMARLWLPAH